MGISVEPWKKNKNLGPERFQLNLQQTKNIFKIGESLSFSVVFPTKLESRVDLKCFFLSSESQSQNNCLKAFPSSQISVRMTFVWTNSSFVIFRDGDARQFCYWIFVLIFTSFKSPFKILVGFLAQNSKSSSHQLDNFIRKLYHSDKNSNELTKPTSYKESIYPRRQLN